MKTAKISGAVIALIIGLSALAFAQTKGAVQYNIASGSKIWFDATSTLHGFSAKSASVTGTIVANTSLDTTSAAAASDSILDATATIPVRTLDSGEKGLDNNMYKAMKADKYPNINFRLTNARAVPATDPVKDGVPFEATGYLTIAGKEKHVKIATVLKPAPGGKLQLIGSKAIVMTNFGIKPPTMMFGMIKVGDRVTVHFDLLLTPTQSVAINEK